MKMIENSSGVGSETPFTAIAPVILEGKVQKDENGNVKMDEIEFKVVREQNDFTVWSNQALYLIQIYQEPSSEHILGTDANGMDVLARIMYGGRISLLVGFVVVIIEMFIGVIMGGIAGYFGGWIDNLIMRLVDIFYCIPSMPILIITGSLFDSLEMDYKTRLVWMMAILGFLGWAGVARMVRGQILSLREQEFMVAAEASGLSTSRRIFRHLVPNVMPQLIVQATMGLGSVIITESTLSFLGLGVKHPMATWGNMMNNITQKVEYLQAYAYIWVPIGCLICLAVIAFNFVGDGLRDAFDPKMKR
jgi:peptide/nickel transport system permease protein